MSTEIAEQDLAALRDEITRLEAMISATREKMTKIAHYIEMARMYEQRMQGAPQGRHGDPTQIDKPRDRSAPKGGLSGKASRESIDIIRQRGTPMKTRDLLAELARRGIEIRGKDPVVVLSGYLSRTDELMPDRKVGWGLKEWADSKHDEPKEHTANGSTNENAATYEKPSSNPAPPWGQAKGSVTQPRN